jgi:DNA-binding transcriptional regulator YiaG
MTICGECGSEHLKSSVLPAYEEDLGGITVRLLNCVIREVCEQCGDATTEIPDLDGLMRAAALARALMPIRLAGSDVRFMRAALNMSGREFAEAMELTPETVSRWENGERGIGGYSEKLLRHNICALLHGDVRGIDYDPAVITRMKIVNPPDGFVFPPLLAYRLMVRDCKTTDEAWGLQKEAA